MTADHSFVNSLGEIYTRPEVERGWRQYFDMVPDYWVRIDREFSEARISVLIGNAGGTYVSQGGAPKGENRWETPAVWVAQVKGQRVAEWRIYSDNEPIREKMRKSIPGSG
jgi:hypothetical protein